jgi:hypothetical protein
MALKIKIGFRVESFGIIIIERKFSKPIYIIFTTEEFIEDGCKDKSSFLVDQITNYYYLRQLIIGLLTDSLNGLS